MATKGIQLDFDLPKIEKSLNKEFETAIKKSVYRVHAELTKILSGSRMGFEYPVPGTGKVENMEKTLANGRVFHYRKLKGATYYTASAPGEAPASRLGDLRTSYRPVVEGKGMLAVGKVGTPLEYGLFLENGTSDIAPRPHLRKAFEKTRAEWEKYFVDLL